MERIMETSKVDKVYLEDYTYWGLEGKREYKDNLYMISI